MVVNNSHYVFNNTNTYETNRFYTQNEQTIKIPSENGEYVDYDGKNYELITNITSSIEEIKNSKYDMLNKEALDALQRPAPFPPLPVEIAGARFEFTVPMRWALPE